MQNIRSAFLKKRKSFLSLLAILMAVLVVRAAFLTIGEDNTLISSLAIMNRSPQSFIALGTQIDKLQGMTSNIDDYKLSEIKEALSTTAQLARYAKREFQAQYDAWLSVQERISNDRESFVQLRQQLDEVQRLQDSEIVRLKRLLDASTKPSYFADSFNLFLSFVVGLLSSILASRLYDWRKTRKANQSVEKS